MSNKVCNKTCGRFVYYSLWIIGLLMMMAGIFEHELLYLSLGMGFIFVGIAVKEITLFSGHWDLGPAGDQN